MIPKESAIMKPAMNPAPRRSRPAAFATLLAAAALFALPAAAQQSPCSWSRDLHLVNGVIHTMDPSHPIVHEVAIQDGKFAYVGPLGGRQLNPCTQTIDLHGRTVVPGLMDDHNHFILFSIRVGNDIRLETATTIPQALALLQHRARTVPAGAWVSTIGDWLPRQFQENRDPTLAELDRAVPHHPVLIVPAFGTAVTNSLGKQFFASHGVAVSPAGIIAPGDATNAAIAALRTIQTPADLVRGTRYAQSYMLRYGVTTSVDMGFFALPGSPDLQDTQAIATIASANPWTAYNTVAAMDRDHTLKERVRLFIISQDQDASLPVLHQRLDDTFPDFGDNRLRISGIGEFATPWFGLNWQQGQRPQNFVAALKLIAAHGWTYQQHTLSNAEVQFTADSYEQVNAVTPIAKLHWSIAHVPTIEPATLAAMKRIGVGLALHGWRYLGGAGGGGGQPATLPAGPPFRTVLASGIHVGAGSDAGDFASLDPFLDLYYMITGRDVTGALINNGEQVTREQAMELYTTDNSWFFPGGDQLGSIQPGKLGDLVVLSADYFNPAQVSDAGLKQLHSVLTVVGGRVVYSDIPGTTPVSGH
ncbi:MAG TPA: amidohydrolase family protein [Terriglobales bacterium]|nr:amidohydrolase family protein [Terriglobales bacterium]